MDFQLSAPTCKKLGGHHSHPYNKIKDKQTEIHDFLDTPEN